jgi:hypothetical protein
MNAFAVVEDGPLPKKEQVIDRLWTWIKDQPSTAAP